MKPYYEHGGITIYHGDCLEVLWSLDAVVNTTVTSPPYNQKIDGFKPSGMQKNWRWAGKISSGYKDSKDESAYQSWQSHLLAGVFAVTAEAGSCFYNHKLRWRDGVLLHPIDIVRRSPFSLRQEIIWRRDGSPTLNARMFAPCDERIYWLRRGDTHKWNQSQVGHLNVWNLNSVKSADHPCAYPIEIPTRCIAATTDVGDVVLDPFSGSGTTMVAAMRMGRIGIGIEADEAHCELSARRLSQVIPLEQPA